MVNMFEETLIVEEDLGVLTPTVEPAPGRPVQITLAQDRPFTVEDLIARAIDKGLPVESLEKLLMMRKALKEEAAREAYFCALNGFQSECPVIVKDKVVKFQRKDGGWTNYAYAPLDKIVEQVQPFLRKYGLSYRIETISDDRNMTAVCIVYHAAGHSEKSTFTVPIDASARMNDSHKVASGNTYAKRYAFCNALGVLTGDEDDDALSTGVAKKAPGPSSAPPTPPASPPAAPPPPAAKAPQGPGEPGLDDYEPFEPDREPYRVPFDGYFDFLKSVTAAKKTLNVLTGADSAYYDVLHGLGFNHASDVKDRLAGKKVYMALQEIIRQAKEKMKS